MGNIGWIKLSTRIFDDEKIQVIEKMPEGHAILLAWIKLLVLGAQGNGDGTVRLSETIPYTDDMLSVIWRLPVLTIRLALETFHHFEMIELHPDQTIEIAHWGVYQQVNDLERIRAQGRERVKRYRERKAIEAVGDDSTDLKNKKTRKRLEGSVTGNVTPFYSSEFEEWWATYPKKVGKSAAFRCFKTQRKKGVTLKELTTARDNYSRSVQRTEQKFIKNPSTFLGRDDWFRDFLGEQGGNGNSETARLLQEAEKTKERLCKT